jgi:VanZ family protein
MVSTIAFFTLYERYQTVGSELLTDPQFTQGFNHWDKSGRGIAKLAANTLLLQVDKPGAGVAVRQSLPDPGQYRLLRLSGKLKSQNIHPGSRFWQKGRLVLVSFDKNQHMMPVPHVVADLQGTLPWRLYQANFRIPQQVHEVQIGVQLIGATGTLIVKNLSLQEIKEKNHFSLYRNLGIAVWVFGLIWLSLPWVSQLRFNLPHLLLYTAVGGIFIGALMPVKFKIDVDYEVSTALATLTRQVDHGAGAAQTRRDDATFVSKWGHVLFFALLAFALWWAYPQVNRLSLLFGLLIFASVSEILQLFIDGRLPQVSDFFIDSLGLLGGIGAFQLARAAWVFLHKKS